MIPKRMHAKNNSLSETTRPSPKVPVKAKLVSTTKTDPNPTLCLAYTPLWRTDIGYLYTGLPLLSTPDGAGRESQQADQHRRSHDTVWRPVASSWSEKQDMALALIWTTHALERLNERGLSRDEIERTVRRLHPHRRPNEGEADWRIDTRRFVVLYDHIDQNDLDAVRIVTAWGKRRQPKRHLKLIDNKDYPEP